MILYLVNSFTEQREEGLLKSINVIQKKMKNKWYPDLYQIRGLLKQPVKITDIFLKRGIQQDDIKREQKIKILLMANQL